MQEMMLRSDKKRNLGENSYIWHGLTALEMNQADGKLPS
jgi:hypothetical protein